MKKNKKIDILSRKKNTSNVFYFDFKQVHVDRSELEYLHFRRQHTQYHLEHEQHDNDHHQMELDDMMYHR